MAPSVLQETWRSFWHTMTSYDRHASHDSPYRTGQHVPLPQSRHDPLTSVATSAIDSRHDLSSPYTHDAANGFPQSPGAGPMSPRSPYSPGLRSASTSRVNTMDDMDDPNANMKKKNRDGIQMQDFNDGQPPPPPVSHSWKRIDRWTEDRYEELNENICEGCTQNDVNELEHELDITLPLDVRESLQAHDGQERGGLPTGIIFGCMLLDCEEIVEEHTNWRRVNEDFLSRQKPNTTIFRSTPQAPDKAFGGVEASSSASPPPRLNTQSPNNPNWRQELQARQDSQPPNAVQRAYAHPAWVPVARDWGGNCLAVDLAPGPAGNWGQVIIFGRDYDCKYVVARSWAHFLAQLADDLNSEHVHIDDESGILSLKPFKNQGAEPPYLEILRWRCDQKYGRRASKQRARPPPGHARPNGLAIDSAVPGASGLVSPYGSPVVEQRGRSPNRFPSRGPGSGASTPRGHVSSPLARVAEEMPAPIPVRSGTPLANNAMEAAVESEESNKGRSSQIDKGKGVAGEENLVSLDSPAVGKENIPADLTKANPRKSQEVKEGELADVAI